LTNRSSNDQSLDDLLEYLKNSRAFDLTGYKPSTISRRITRRLQQVEVASFSDYQDYLEVHPDEFEQLFNTVLINITSFFRDPESWDALSRDVLPAILAGKSDNDAIRVWCAGCSSGEEAFTLAMIWADKLGVDRFLRRVKIYATDVDDDAITKARHAVYTAKEIEPVPENLQKRYFQKSGRDRYTFRADVRRAVIVGRHDLIRDAPISNLDFLSCRNTLIYFNAETQARILGRFHFALNRAGLLFLGKGELLLTHASLFRPIDLKRRLFSKADQPDVRERLSALGFEPTTSTPAGFGARIKSEIAKWDKVVRAANIRIE